MAEIWRGPIWDPEVSGRRGHGTLTRQTATPIDLARSRPVTEHGVTPRSLPRASRVHGQH